MDSLIPIENNLAIKRDSLPDFGGMPAGDFLPIALRKDPFGRLLAGYPFFNF